MKPLVLTGWSMRELINPDFVDLAVFFSSFHTALLRSPLSLTEFGKAVVAHEEDFSRHNPIDRWWGGTHLTNEPALALRPRSDEAVRARE